MQWNSALPGILLLRAKVLLAHTLTIYSEFMHMAHENAMRGNPRFRAAINAGKRLKHPIR
jgi:hypothetical protein